jgi:hypothetical protein
MLISDLAINAAIGVAQALFISLVVASHTGSSRS